MKPRRLQVAITSSVVLLTTIVGSDFLVRAQTSSPTNMTLAILRGPDWSRLRTAMPLIIAGKLPGKGREAGPSSWNAAASLVALGNITFFQALEDAKPLFLSNVEGASSEKVSAEIPKNLDFNLTPQEVTVVKDKLTELKQRMVAYDVSSISSDETEARKLFEFAKSLNVATIVSDPPPAALMAIDKLANEYGINVAILNRSRSETPAYADPKDFLKAVAGLSPRVGACVDTASWMQQGIKPIDGLKLLKDRVIALNLLDRSSLGSSGHTVTLGSGVADVKGLLAFLYRTQVKPSFIAVGYAGPGDAVVDMSKSFDAYEGALQPIAADRVDEISRTTPIRGPERLTEKDRAGIEAAVPSEAPAKAKQQRKLLVLDLNVSYGGHGSIPAANMAIDLWSKKTGAYSVVFDNNLDNLKYPKIKEFDGVFLNNTVGQDFVDPQVREGLLRFIREGGGLFGYHGTSHASIDWMEFGEMLGARAGSHRDFKETATLKIDDPESPLTAAFEGKEFEWQDEFYRFTTPPYSRENVHVLLSFDAAKTDMHQKPDCNICDRADNDIAVSWIRSYGKGRVFYASIGHSVTLFESPSMSKFFLAGIQFILGDLKADTTPSAKLTASRR